MSNMEKLKTKILVSCTALCEELAEAKCAKTGIPSLNLGKARVFSDLAASIKKIEAQEDDHD